MDRLKTGVSKFDLQVSGIVGFVVARLMLNRRIFELRDLKTHQEFQQELRQEPESLEQIW